MVSAHTQDRRGTAGDRRRAPRIRLDAAAHWTVGRTDYRADLDTLSVGGASVAGAAPAVGSRFACMLRVQDVAVNRLSVEVFQLDDGRSALRFLDLTDEQRDTLEVIVEALDPSKPRD